MDGRKGENRGVHAARHRQVSPLAERIARSSDSQAFSGKVQTFMGIVTQGRRDSDQARRYIVISPRASAALIPFAVGSGSPGLRSR